MSKIKTDYAAIEASSLKNQIIQKLNDSGVLSDQNYEGSNITQIINIFSYTHDILMFYLNKVSNENSFSDAQIYENLVRLVKGINYNPVGYQTSTLSFSLSADNTVSTGTYTIPRYSYIRIGSSVYSFSDDITFIKSVSATEDLTEVSDNYLLYQGSWIEYPLQIAAGNENETFNLGVNSDVKVDHFNIHVYVRDSANVWSQWKRTNSLYFSSPDAKEFELILGPKKTYEFKFGDDINGKKLTTNDQIAIYYLVSSGESGEVGVNVLNSLKPIPYSSNQYNQIVPQTLLANNTVLSQLGMKGLILSNDYISSKVGDYQSVDEIREMAPFVARSGGKLVSKNDYLSFVKTNFRNVVLDAKVYSNNDYLSNYVKYFYNNGIKQFNTESRALLSQTKFSNSCNFNNIYVIVVPRGFVNTDKKYINFLTQSQKTLIKQSCESTKMEGAEVIVIDPVYISFSFGVLDTNESESDVTAQNTTIEIKKTKNSSYSDQYIKEKFANVILNYFEPTNMKLGQKIDFNELNTSLLSIDGLSEYYMINGSTKFGGLSLILWNDVYKKSYTITNKSYNLETFQFPYFDLSLRDIINKITIV